MKNLKEKNNILADNVEYIIIQNEKTGEIIAKITRSNFDVISPFLIRIKEKS